MNALDATARDRALVAATLDGNIEAFSMLVERHREPAQRLATRIVGSAAEGEDVVQDAFLNAFSRLATLRDPDGFKPWLMQITYNRALSVVDRRRRSPEEARIDDVSGARETEAAHHRKTPASQLEEAERRERMMGKIASISAVNRTPLVLRDVDGYSYEEIAELTDAPVGSVKGRIHRARRQLIEMLRSNTYDWELPDDA